MGNPFRGEVTLVIGVAEYRLVCDFNAICEIEAHFDGESIAEIMPRFDDGTMGFTDYRAVTAALLRHHWPEVKFRDAGDVLSLDPEAVRSAIDRAFRLAAPDPDDPGKKL
jgi:hypothetical protein